MTSVLGWFVVVVVVLWTIFWLLAYAAPLFVVVVACVVTGWFLHRADV